MIKRIEPPSEERVALSVVSFESKECLIYPKGAPRPPKGQSVSFGEKLVVFEVDERLLYVVEKILI